jgi:hypothetical protein
MAKLPSVVSSLPQDVKAFINQVREAIDGRNGDRLLTVNDLVSSGIASTGPGNTITPPPGLVGTPSTPRNVQASGAIQNIIVTWDDPLYNGHSHAEIWGSSTNDFSAAVQIGMTPGAVFVDAVGPSVTRYYWVRFINVLGVVGAFNAIAGVQGITGPAVDYLLSTLTGAITETQLFSTLGNRINLIDGPTSLAGSVAARVYAEEQARIAADTTLGSSITTLQTTTATQATAITSLTTRTTTAESNIINLQTTTATQATAITSLTTRTTTAESNITTLQSTTATQASQISTLSTTTATNTAAISTEATTRASETGSLFAKYTVKVDVNGYVSGFGLASVANNGVTVSDFIIRADRFSVASPSGPGLTPIIPFVVNTTTQTINGVSVPAGVYMDAAFIKNGTITNAKIGNAAIDDAKIANLSAGKITAGFISADRIQAGSIDAKIATLDAAVIGTGVINDARIGSLSVDKLLAGTTTSQGGVTFGFGLGTSVYGIATAGYFKSSNAGTAGLAGIATNSVGVAGNTASTSSYGALFSNTYGYDSISSIYVVTGLSVAGPNFGIFTQRKSQQGASTAEGAPSTYTAAYSYLAYLDGSAHYGGKLFTTNTSGVDVRGIIAGGPTYGLTVSGGTAPFTGCHDGLMLKTITAIAGDIVVDTGVVVATDGVTDTITEVTPSASANQKGAIGVFAAVSPQIPKLLQISVIVPKWEHEEWVDTVEYKLNPIYQPIVDTHDYVAINSVGEGQINVCGENGDFAVGDLIVTSSTPGKGMKQTDDIVRSSTVAKIRENVTFASPTEVKLVSCIYMCG